MPTFYIGLCTNSTDVSIIHNHDVRPGVMALQSCSLPKGGREGGREEGKYYIWPAPTPIPTRLLGSDYD